MTLSPAAAAHAVRIRCGAQRVVDVDGVAIRITTPTATGTTGGLGCGGETA